MGNQLELRIKFPNHQIVLYHQKIQTLTIGKYPEWRFLAWEISDFYGPKFQSPPAQATRRSCAVAGINGKTCYDTGGAPGENV